MKLQDFLIGLGAFALFTITIFGFINNDGGDCQGIYCEGFLNVTHSTETAKAISNISKVGKQTDADFQGIRDDMKDFSTNRSASVIPTEGNLIAEAIKVLISLPSSWKPIANVMRMSEEQFQIPQEFTNWIIASVIIIIILILLAAFLKNKLQS